MKAYAAYLIGGVIAVALVLVFRKRILGMKMVEKVPDL